MAEPQIIARVGSNLAELRRARGWSAAELARRAGVGKATLSEIEAGRRNATLETLFALTTALSVPLSQPLLGAEAQSGPPRVEGQAVIAELAACYEDTEATTELYRVTVRALAPTHPAAHGTGLSKTAIGFTGVLAVAFDDDAFQVEAGESRTWAAERPHTYVAVGGEDAELAILMRYSVGV